MIGQSRYPVGPVRVLSLRDDDVVTRAFGACVDAQLEGLGLGASYEGEELAKAKARERSRLYDSLVEKLSESPEKSEETLAPFAPPNAMTVFIVTPLTGRQSMDVEIVADSSVDYTAKAWRVEKGVRRRALAFREGLLGVENYAEPGKVGRGADAWAGLLEDLQRLPDVVDYIGGLIVQMTEAREIRNAPLDLRKGVAGEGLPTEEQVSAAREADGHPDEPSLGK